PWSVRDGPACRERPVGEQDRRPRCPVAPLPEARWRPGALAGTGVAGIMTDVGPPHAAACPPTVPGTDRRLLERTMREERSQVGLPTALWAASVLLLARPVPAGAAGLIAHWPLAEDARDRSGGLHGAVQGGVAFARVAGRPAAVFNGRDGYLEVRHGPALALGRTDFSVA